MHQTRIEVSVLPLRSREREMVVLVANGVWKKADSKREGLLISSGGGNAQSRHQLGGTKRAIGSAKARLEPSNWPFVL